MDELIQNISAKVGIDASLASTAVGKILAFLQKEGPTDLVNQLIDAVPGAQGLVEAANAEEGGGGGLMGMLGGLMGGSTGGIMALGSQLMEKGLSMDQIGSVGQELFAHAREQVGEDTMGEIVNSIPGLSKFV